MSNKEQITLLDEWQQIAYGASLVERMYPNFSLFNELTETEGDRVFRDILNLTWEYASGKNLSIDFQKQLDKLELVTPDPQQFEVYGVLPALDAAVGLSSLLSACSRSDPLEILAINTLSQATIDTYQHAINDIDDRSLHEADVAFKKDIIKLLCAKKNAKRSEIITEIKLLINELGASNIGISMT